MTYTKYTRWSVECDGRGNAGARCGKVEYGPTKRAVFEAARACSWILLKGGSMAFCYDHHRQARQAKLSGTVPR